jgi:hypothetical protein
VILAPHRTAQISGTTAMLFATRANPILLPERSFWWRGYRLELTVGQPSQPVAVSRSLLRTPEHGPHMAIA